MFFKLVNAFVIFQFYINRVFIFYLDVFCIVYLNDILIYFNTEEEHVNYVKKVLQCLKDY